MLKRVHWVLVLALLATAGRARADDPRGSFRFRAFGSAEGLHNLVVVSITEDSTGALWVATDDGIYRWNGERFDHFTVDQGLPSTMALVVARGADGRVCAGTGIGLACFDGARFSTSAGEGLPAAAIHTIATVGDREWVGAADGLYVRRGRARFARAPGWVGTGPVKALWVDAEGVVVADGGRLFESDGAGQWRELAAIGLAGDRIDGVFRDREGALWIRCALHTWKLARGDGHAIDVGAALPTGYDLVGVATSMIDGPDGHVWFGTDTGIAARTGDTWRILDRSAGLPSSGARTLYRDRHGTVWVGGIGLFQLRGHGLLEYHDLSTGLPGDVGWSFARDGDGAMWVGTNRCLARAVGGQWTCMPGTTNRVVRSFLFPPQGGVFVGGAPSDLLYIDPAGAVTSMPFAQAPAADHMVLALGLGPEGDLWVATKAGLWRLRGAVPGTLERVSIPGIAPGARFSSLLVRDGRLWSATPDGIVVLDHGTWTVFGVHAGFRATSMRYVVGTHGRRMCVAYVEAIGISCFESDGKTVSHLQHIGTAEGLGTGMVYFIGEDRAERLWVGTGDGVDVVTPEGVEHFGQTDGLAGDDAAGMAFFEDRDGSLWLGSTGGATHAHAERYAGVPAAPHVVLRNGALGDHLFDGANLPAQLATSHDRGSLSVEFGTDHLVDASRIAYQLRLSPGGKTWSPSRAPEARYPRLLPGAYELEIRARIDHGAWGPPTKLAFVVEPAWWQTRWFAVLAVLTALVVVGVGFAWRARILLRRRTRQLAEQSEANVRELLDVMPDLVTVYRDGKAVYQNRTARRMWASLGAPFEGDGHIHPDDRARRLAMLEQAASPDEPPAVYVLRARAPDGSWRTCEVSSVRLALGGASVVVACGRDVTERDRLRAQVLVTERMASLGTLAAGVGHEINNPLAYVIGNLHLIGELIGGDATPELAGAVRDAAEGAERVRKIVGGLRSFSRSEKEQRTAQDVAEVLRSSARLASNEIRHRAQLVWELESVPPVSAEEGRLAQVFLNLIVNAAQAIPDGRSDENRITLRTSTDARGRVVIEISDTGSGMPPEVVARAFEPFFTTKEVGAGTGLGLSICHGIITSLGGEIALDTTPGRGTTVRVCLPPCAAASPAPALAPPPALAPAPVDSATSSRARVMVVDDDPQVAQIMSRLLRRDYEVTVASCGREALDQIEAGAWFDVVISDVMMPNMTGLELLDELVRVVPAQARRLIFLSGGVFAPETRARLDELGTMQLEKPVDARQLRAAIAQVIETAPALAPTRMAAG